MDYKRLIGLRIKSIREAKGLTQERLAERIDINTVYLSNIECGRANPTLDMLIKITKALNVDMWEVFDFESERNPRELREKFRRLINEIDERKLKTAIRALEVIMR